MKQITMKYFFIFLGIVGVVALIGAGVFLCVGVPAHPTEVVKTIEINQ